MCQQRFLLLPDESQEEFDAMSAMWRKDYLDDDGDLTVIESLLTAVVERDWLQQRCLRNINKLEVRLAQAEADHDELLIDRLEKRLQNAHRYKTAAENSFSRALRNIEQFRKARVREDHREWRLEQLEDLMLHKIALECVKAGIRFNPKERQEQNGEKRPKAQEQPGRGSQRDAESVRPQDGPSDSRT